MSQHPEGVQMVASTSAQVSETPSVDGVTPNGKKRRKAARACDPCRDRKLKCDWIPDRVPPICFECAKRSIRCESVKPAKIDPRKRAKLEAQEQHDPLRESTAPPPLSAPISAHWKPTVASASFAAPLPVAPHSTASPVSVASGGPANATSSGLDMLARCVDRVSKRMQEHDRSPSPDTAPETSYTRTLGETSITQFLAQLQPSEDLSKVDREFGLFRAQDGSVRTVIAPTAVAESKVSRPHGTLTTETVLQLVQHFIDEILPLFPILRPEDLRSLDQISPVLLFSICALAASSRKFSHELFDTLRAFLETAIEMGDPFSTSSITNVQTILIMTVNCEIHGAVSTRNGSLSFLRAGNGIRMAQDLGLHRRPTCDQPMEVRQTKMRVWMCCVIHDTCYSASPGQPSMIDLDDCYNCSDHFEGDAYLVEMYKLCMLLSRAMKAVNRVRLTKTTDEQLERILRDFDQWRLKIPEALQFAGADSSIQAGVLHSVMVAFESIFLSPFVKQDATLPPHLTFRPSRARWFAVVNRSQLAIDWTLQYGTSPLDSWFIAFYSLMRAASVQFFDHTKNGSLRSLQAIEAVKTGLTPWAAWSCDGPLSTRAKVLKIATLLWQAAARRHQPATSASGRSVEEAMGSSQHGPGPVELMGTPAAPTSTSMTYTASAPAPPISSPAAFPSSPVFTASPLLLPTYPGQSASNEGALPLSLQNEWQGWCDDLLSAGSGWDFLDETNLPGLL